MHPFFPWSNYSPSCLCRVPGLDRPIRSTAAIPMADRMKVTWMIVCHSLAASVILNARSRFASVRPRLRVEPTCAPAFFNACS